MALWKEDLAKTNPKAAQSLADPMQYENLFPELKQALQAEEALKSERSSLEPAATFTSRPVREMCVLPPSSWGLTREIQLYSGSPLKVLI